MKHLFACALAGVLCLATASAHAQDTAEQETSASEKESKRTPYCSRVSFCYVGITGGTLASFNNAQPTQRGTVTDASVAASVGIIWGSEMPLSSNFALELGNQIEYTSIYHNFLVYRGSQIFSIPIPDLEERYYFLKSSADSRWHWKPPLLNALDPSIFFLAGYQFRLANFYRDRVFVERVIDHGYQVGLGVDFAAPAASGLRIRQEYIFTENFDGSGNRKRGIVTHGYVVGLLYPF